MNLKEAAQQALEYLEQHAIISGIPIRDALRAALEPVTTCHELSKEWDKLSLPFDHFADAGKMVATSHESRQVEDRFADTGKTYDETDDTPEQRMLRKKWFGGRLYGHLPFLEAVDETMKSLYDKLDEAQGTWKMLDNAEVTGA